MATKTSANKPARSNKATRSTPAAKGPIRIPASRKAAAKGGSRSDGAASAFRSKLALANVADGAKNIKQVLRAVERLAKQLGKLDEAGVKLEQPVARNVAMLVTSDAKAAKRFGMEEKRGGAKKAGAQKAGGPKADAQTAGGKKAAGRKAGAKSAKPGKPAKAGAQSEGPDMGTGDQAA